MDETQQKILNLLEDVAVTADAEGGVSALRNALDLEDIRFLGEHIDEAPVRVQPSIQKLVMYYLPATKMLDVLDEIFEWYYHDEESPSDPDDPYKSQRR